ncbi:chromosome transmission fidelity protein 8 [Lipomyces japonicus]|uniref:chromosome transmission fidelity protein 8 n=1 Tax=Lipomyces japonicus TaxID=56871 RepID=UPI0034CDB8E4
MPTASIQLTMRAGGSMSQQPAALPTVLQTPSGLALIEIQGTIHTSGAGAGGDHHDDDEPVHEIGRLVFQGSTVWLWIGRHQRMEGSIVDLKPPLGLIKRVQQKKNDHDHEHEQEQEQKDHDESGNPHGTAVEIVEIIRKKIVFLTRPEPIVNTEEV